MRRKQSALPHQFIKILFNELAFVLASVLIEKLPYIGTI